MSEISYNSSYTCHAHTHPELKHTFSAHTYTYQAPDSAENVNLGNMYRVKLEINYVRKEKYMYL